MNKLKKISKLSYKNRFSIYYKPEETLIRVYYSDGKQHKERGRTFDEACDKMIQFLKRKTKKVINT